MRLFKTWGKKIFNICEKRLAATGLNSIQEQKTLTTRANYEYVQTRANAYQIRRHFLEKIFVMTCTAKNGVSCIIIARNATHLLHLNLFRQLR